MKFNHIKKCIFTIGFLLTMPISTEGYAQTDAQLMASGQWRDPTTNLVWMRCNIGQKWNGQTCIGEAKPMTGFEAQDFAAALQHGNGFAGHTDWRLPTPYELSMLRTCSTGWHASVSHQVAEIDGTVRNVPGKPEMMGLPPNNYVPIKCAENAQQPTLNSRVFPNTSVAKHGMWWTSQNFGAHDIIYVNFRNGIIDKVGGITWKGHVRLVR